MSKSSKVADATPAPGDELTTRGRQVIDYIRAFTARAGYAPSVREIGDGCGYANKQSVHYQLKKLKAAGHLLGDGRLPSGRTVGRTLRLADESSDFSLPLRGDCPCGPPIEPTDDDDRLDLRAMFGRDDLAAFKARGDSMIEDGIKEGDYLVVRATQEPANGDKIVAQLDRTITLKRYFRESKTKARLEPCNGKLSPVWVDLGRQYFQALGVLHAVIRLER